MKFSREWKRLWLAIVGSVFVHLLVAFSLAAFGRASAPLPEPEEAPVQLTMVDLSSTPPPTLPTKPTYVETDPANESKEKPKEQTFESNANSIAKSNSPPTGDAPLPSQEGRDRPFLEMQTQRSSLPSEGLKGESKPQPTPPPQPTPTPAPVQTPKPKPSERPKPTPLPEPSATPAPELLALLSGTPPPALRDTEEAEATPPPQVGPTVPPVTSRPRPESAASAYQPEKQQTRVTGRLSDRGPSAVNAVATPLGRYQKAVSDAIGVLWYRYTKEKMDLISIGTAHIEGEVDAQGKVRNLRVVSNDANETFANICLQSFQEAQIPPIPPDLVATLPDGRLQLDFHFTTYANR
jgi:outer membrane biosynthesis protein TonB